MAVLLDEAAVGALLTPAEALAGVEESFRLLANGGAVNEPRHRSAAGGTTMNVMWALAPALDVIALKSYPVVRSDVSQAAVILVTLYSHSTGECLGIVQAGLLGQRRTGAASALATRLVARPDSRTLTVFGTGYQAAGQVRAISAVLPRLRTVNVVGRALSRSEAFIAAVSEELPELTFRACEPEEAVRSADVIVTSTGAREPLFRGDWLQPGTHVNAIGNNQAQAREIDRATLTRAQRVIVDSRRVAAIEGGDFITNHFDVAHAIELAEVLEGDVVARRDDSDITVFESHGLAVQDLVCSFRVLKAAEAAGCGQRVDWPDKQYTA